MAKLVKLKGNTYYIETAASIGIIVNDEGRAIIVDTGIDDDSGRKTLRLIKEEGFIPAAIINTHFHADHCGGNSFIIKRESIPVYASGLEKAAIENPILEPYYLFSANPLTVMKNKFLMAKESKVDYVVQEGKLEIEGVELNIIPLPGHSPEMIGVATPDDVLFVGDAFFSDRILEKYALAYCTDIGKALDTLKYLKTLKYDYFVPAHGVVLEDPNPTIDRNIEQIYEIKDKIEAFCNSPKSREEIVAYISGLYNIKLNISQYYLTSSTISAYLSYMTDQGMLGAKVTENNIKWTKVIKEI